jgi:uncharacterized protein (TIGR00725 family)
MWERKPVIGVFGSAGGSNLEALKESAGIIVYEIAKLGCIIVTGGCPGLPHEAALAARRLSGMVVGFSPAMNKDQHIHQFKFPIDPYTLMVFTGMEKKGRNVISIRTCDATVFISGRTGTLNEFTIAYDEATEKHVIGLLAGSGGAVDEHIIPLTKTIEKKGKAEIIIHNDPQLLVKMVYEKLQSIE